MRKGCTMQDELPFELTKDQKRIEELEEKCHLFESTIIEMMIKIKELAETSQGYMEICKKIREHGH